MNTCTLNNLPIYDPPESYHGPTMNCFTMHSGAARYGVGHFLMTRADYESLSPPNASIGASPGTATLIMKSADSGPPASGQQASANDQDQTLKLTVRIAGAVPFSVAATGTGNLTNSQARDMVEVIVFDSRCDLFYPLDGGFNVQKDGFSYSGSNPDFYSSTLHGGTTYDWSYLLTNAFALNSSQLPDDLPSWKPRNLVWDQVPYGRAMDDVAARIFYVIGFDHAKTGRSGLQIFKPGKAFDSNNKLREKAAKFWIGGTFSESELKRFPGTFKVIFKASDQDNPDDPFANRAYTKNVSNGLGDPAYIQALHIGEYVAVRKSSAWVEQATFDSVASDMASRARRAMLAPKEEETYAGIWPFKPDGAFRGIRWISDRGGARTIVRFNNDRDFSPMDDNRRATVSASNQLVTGLGGTNVSVSQSGTRMVWNRSTGQCGPDVTLGEAGMKDSHVTTPDGEPDATTWDRTSSNNSPGIWMVTGFRTDPGSPGDCLNTPPKIWMYKRLFVEDTRGALCSVAAEAASIFAVGCCPPQTTISSASFGATDAEATAAAANLSRISLAGVA